jgi:hypothetical protein
LHIQAASIIAIFDGQKIALLLQAHINAPGRAFAYGHPLGSGFNAVIQEIANDVDKDVGQEFMRALLEFEAPGLDVDNGDLFPLSIKYSNLFRNSFGHQLESVGLQKEPVPLPSKDRPKVDPRGVGGHLFLSHEDWKASPD